MSLSRIRFRRFFAMFKCMHNVMCLSDFTRVWVEKNNQILVRAIGGFVNRRCRNSGGNKNAPLEPNVCFVSTKNSKTYFRKHVFCGLLLFVYAPTSISVFFFFLFGVFFPESSFLKSYLHFFFFFVFRRPSDLRFARAVQESGRQKPTEKLVYPYGHPPPRRTVGSPRQALEREPRAYSRAVLVAARRPERISIVP